MSKETMIKAAVSAGGLSLFAAVGDIMGRVPGLHLALAVLMLLDYATGVAKAWRSGTVSSRVGIDGILRKACYIVVIALGLALDYLTTTIAGSAGMAGFVSAYMTAVVALWLCANEGISILENLSALGVPFPSFIKTAFLKARESAEKAGEERAKEDGHDGN